MTAIRVALVALLWVPLTLQAAPAPTPRRVNDHAAFERLKRQLREQSVLVLAVTQDGPNEWLVTFFEFRRDLAILTKRQCLMTGAGRCAALAVLLEHARAAREREMRLQGGGCLQT